MATGSDNPLLVVIVGETASGKSQLAVKMAEELSGEIIAADSWTVYKSFNIGTAKPGASERARIPHHLLDVADPREGFSAAAYKRLALHAIDNIAARGKVPILVGGTGLYIDSVIFDYSFLPPAEPALRHKLNSMGIPELLERIDEEGIDTTGIDLRNKRRLIRLIEANGRRPTQADMRLNTLVVGVKLSPEQRRSNIVARVDAMLAAGLEQEVAALAAEYGWGVEPMKGIGYREFREYFDGTQTLAQTRNRIISATMGLAKRQRTWFKRNNSIHWVYKQSEAVDLLTTLLSK